MRRISPKGGKLKTNPSFRSATIIRTRVLSRVGDFGDGLLIYCDDLGLCSRRKSRWSNQIYAVDLATYIPLRPFMMVTLKLLSIRHDMHCIDERKIRRIRGKGKIILKIDQTVLNLLKSFFLRLFRNLFVLGRHLNLTEQLIYLVC